MSLVGSVVVASSPSGLLFFCLYVATGNCVDQALLPYEHPNLEAVIKDWPAVVAQLPVLRVDVHSRGQSSPSGFQLSVSPVIARQP